jgi:peptide/nickel transport system ATP-binding protein
MSLSKQTDHRRGGAPGSVLLEIQGLRIEGQSEEAWHEIVKGVDLTLKRGEVLGLIGESGAGKSTIGLAAMGYARPGCRITAGSIRFDSVNLTDVSEAERRKIRGARIAYVAQSAAASFNPAHRIIDQYAEAPLQHGVMGEAEAKRTAVDLFRRLRLPDAEHIGFRYPHQVSGGQLQRAMTAMAMACRPDLIIFDEPTTALDVTTQIEVLAAIKDIVQQFNTAAIYITHDLAVVAQMADRVMVLRYGELVEEAPTGEMLSNPQQAYTKSLWAVRSLRKEEEPGEGALLRVRGVDAGYSAAVKVLQDITVEVPRGRTVAVVGESGSGKSTLARAFTGLAAFDGELCFAGRTLRGAGDMDRLYRRDVQIVFQHPDASLNPRQRVAEILSRPMVLYGDDDAATRRRRIGELLEQVKLPAAFARRYPHQLSGGEKQRVAIARAFASHPKLVICDEITSSLDVSVQAAVIELLLELQSRHGTAYLFITHDLNLVRQIAHRIAVMYRGDLVELMTIDELAAGPRHPYTRALMDAIPAPAGVA